jgi:hypothetical protein
MSTYIHLQQTTKSLPLKEKELIYINVNGIIYTTKNKYEFLKNIDSIDRARFMIHIATNETLVYPRFNLDRISHTVKRNPSIHFIPNHETALDSTSLFDLRSLQLQASAEDYDKVYIFWSGGIDSTLVLCSVLRNFKNLSKIVVVLNKHSIAEYPDMYTNYIEGKLATISTDEFFDSNIQFSHNNLYTSGEIGGPLISFDSFENFNERYPGIHTRPWKNHVNEILKYFTENTNINSAVFTYNEIIETAQSAKIDLRTVYEFLWWVNFNWGHDIDIVSMLWNYQQLDDTINSKKFIEQNCFFWYNGQEFQNWAVSLLGQELMSRGNIQKYIYKKYIYEFNNDLDYFKYKNKEVSTPKNAKLYLNKKVLAIDTDYNFYYR